jgi:hypothetical protein
MHPEQLHSTMRLERDVAVAPTDALPRADRGTLLRWVADREKEIDSNLKERQYKLDRTEDFYLITIPLILREGSSVEEKTFFRDASQEIETRYRAAGWDEAKVDGSTGKLSLKRFRRRVLVTYLDAAGEVSAPVYENESPDQAARRIITEGFKYGRGGGASSVYVVSPERVQWVRIEFDVQK